MGFEHDDASLVVFKTWKDHRISLLIGNSNHITKSNLKIGTNNDNLIVNTKRYDGSYMDRQNSLSSVLIFKVKKFKQV